MQMMRCMHSGDAVGGVVDVFWQKEPPAEIRGDRGCVRVYVTAVNGEFRVQSYSKQGKRIQFCGHGALAAAWVAFQHAPDAESLNFFNANQSWQGRHAGDDITLIYRRPMVQAAAVPEWATAALGADPLGAALVGDDTGYLIIELTDADSVQAMEPDLDALAAATERAVIVTACESNTEFVFRYFAPQYGTPEDAATGSAAVQLAAYWGAKLPAEEFHVRQLSHQGAVMRVACLDNAVELTGRVTYR